LPVRGVWIPDAASAGDGTGKLPNEQVLAEACSRSHVTWDRDSTTRSCGADLWNSVGKDDLFFMGSAWQADVKGARFARTGASVLVCPDTWTPVTRILLLDEGILPVDNLYGVAASLCRGLGVSPVVLTLASSLRVARRRLESLRQPFDERRVSAEFDLLAGTIGHDAVSNVARWRRCQLGVVPRYDGPRWRQWLHGGALSWHADAPAGLALLMLSLPRGGDSPVDLFGDPRDATVSSRTEEARMTSGGGAASILTTSGKPTTKVGPG